MHRTLLSQQSATAASETELQERAGTVLICRTAQLFLGVPATCVTLDVRAAGKGGIRKASPTLQNRAEEALGGSVAFLFLYHNGKWPELIKIH